MTNATISTMTSNDWANLVRDELGGLFTSENESQWDGMIENLRKYRPALVCGAINEISHITWCRQNQNKGG